MLFALGAGGCFARNAAEGHFLEAENSGRYSTYSATQDLRRIHLFRLNLRQFDEDIGGTVELFRVARYATFELEPKVVTTPAQNYFCTRIDRGISRGDEMTVEFRDELSRRWRFSGQLVDDGELVEGKLERLAATGDVVDLEDPEIARRALLPEDLLYLQQKQQLDWGHLILERRSEQVNDEQLGCVLLELANELVLSLSSELIAELGNRRVRAAVVMTKAEISNDVSKPLRGLFRKEFGSASMDSFDLVDDSRTILVRRKPELLVDLTNGIGVATVVLFEDTARGEGSCELGDCNDRWDNLLDDAINERVLGYVPSKVLLFNASAQAVSVHARNSTGQASAEALFDASRRVEGWSAYGFYGTPLSLSKEKVMLIDSLQDAPADDELLLELMPEACQTCYSPSTAELPSCADCPALLPLLFL